MTDSVEPTVGDEATRETLIVRGRIKCCDRDEAYVRARLKQVLRSVDPDLKLDEIFVADPLVREDVYDRPLFQRRALVPSQMSMSVDQRAICGAVPTVLVTTSMWFAIIAMLLKIGSSQGELRMPTRRIYSFVSAGLFFASTLIYVPSLQPFVMVRNVLASFDYWYLQLHVIALAYLESRGLMHVHPEEWENILVHSIYGFSLTVGFLIVDAIKGETFAKAGRFTMLAVLCGAQILNWAVGHDHRLVPIALGVFDSTAGALAQTLYLTLGAYMIRFAVASLTAGGNTAVYLSISAY